MSDDQDNSRDATAVQGRADALESRGRAGPPTARSGQRRQAPAPEFLSLTYTLPHHLVVQIEELAEETNRSPSEVLAESFRLYCKVRASMETRTRISTVNGFAYQEVELAEAVVDGEAIRHDEPGNGATAPDDSTGPSASRAIPAADPAPREPRIEEPADPPEPAGTTGPEDAAGPAPAAGAGDQDGSPAHCHDAQPAVDDEPVDGTRADGDARVEAAESVAVATETPREPDTGDAPHASVEAPAEPESPEPTTDERADATGTDPGWAALQNVKGQRGERRPSRDSESTATGPAEGSRAAERLDLDVARRGPQPDEQAAEEIRGRLLPLAREPIDSDRLRRVLEAIMREVDRKDHSPPDHSRKVADLSRRLASLHGLEGEELLVVELGGLLHDIGKACVPDDLIRHVRLTKEELAFVRRYPRMGAELLSVVPALEPVMPLVLGHQERWDGSGYPEELEGSQIPVGAQIVALCDIYDTLITERRYRPAYPEERAVQIIRENVGRLWNPELATPFIKKLLDES